MRRAREENAEEKNSISLYNVEECDGGENTTESENFDEEMPNNLPEV